jgi:hypothetical protein
MGTLLPTLRESERRAGAPLPPLLRRRPAKRRRDELRLRESETQDLSQLPLVRERSDARRPRQPRPSSAASIASLAETDRIVTVDRDQTRRDADDPIHPEGIYVCTGCGQIYAEYVNGCPRCGQPVRLTVRDA